jgi:hypothetical protein
VKALVQKLALLAWLPLALAACGGRATSEPAAIPRDAEGAAKFPDAVVFGERPGDAVDSAPSDAGAGGEASDASQDAAEAASDAGDGVSPGDAPADGAMRCGCSDGDWFIELELDGTSFRLSEAYPISVHCLEDAPLVVDNCAGGVRLMGCAGAERGAPCLYLGVQDGAFLLGHVVDASGAYLPLADASLDLEPAVDGGRRGTYAARVSVDGQERTVAGSFHVCASPRPECSR